MNRVVENAMRHSVEDFLGVVWPTISEYLGGGEIIPVEVVTDSGFTEKLDTLAGIDAWHILSNKMGMRAIASRVQWRDKKWNGRYPFNTFTIRHSTPYGDNVEEKKRRFALAHKDRGILYPHITVQAYLDEYGGPLLSFGIIKTEELFTYLDARHWPLIPGEDGNRFWALSWRTLVGLGCYSILYKDNTTGESCRV